MIVLKMHSEFANSGADGVAITNLNYISGESDKINNLTIQAKIKASSENSSKQRIILSFDRSSVFRLSIGHDSSSISSAANGKLAFSFTNSDGTHDKYDAGYLGNLKDDQWHDIVIMFEANEPHGLKYYVDGSLTYSDPVAYTPISNQSTSETPRYGIVGNGSELTSPSGSIAPNDPFKGWIREIKMSTSDIFPPSLNLSSTSNNLRVKQSDTVTITADFSEALISTPTFSITGIATNVLMTATNSPTQWIYIWYVLSSNEKEVTATASGTDLAGNPYTGNESISFKIDNTPPSVESFEIINNNTLSILFTEAIFSDLTNQTSSFLNNDFYATIQPTSFENKIISGDISSTFDYPGVIDILVPSSIKSSENQRRFDLTFNNLKQHNGSITLQISRTLYDLAGNSISQLPSSTSLSCLTVMKTESLMLWINVRHTKDEIVDSDGCIKVINDTDGDGY